MRRIIYILFFLLFAFSCEDRTPQPVLIPQWLKPRLVELEDSGNCNGCTVQRWSYKNEFFYHVYCSYWSCSDCEIYYYNGDLVDWEVTDRLDFETNKNRPEKIWECGGEINAD